MRMEQNSFHTVEQRTASQIKPLSVQSWKKGSALFKQSETEKNFENILNQINDTTNPKLTYAYQQGQFPAANKKPYEFMDVIDVINPLQHLPIVGTLYRNITGDELHPASRIIGSSIYGGPVGAVSATLNTVSEMQTGKDLGDHILGMARGDLPERPVDYTLAHYSYQDMDSDRTAGWQIDYRRPFEPDYMNSSFAYEPVTELSLSPMPPKRILTDA